MSEQKIPDISADSVEFLMGRIATLEAEIAALKSMHFAAEEEIDGALEVLGAAGDDRTLEVVVAEKVTALKSTVASLLSIDDSKVAEYVVLSPEALREAAGNRVAELEAKVRRLEAPVTQELYEDGRCQVCGWPLSKTVEAGCVPENCSMRPREGGEEWFRLKERREWLASRYTPPAKEAALERIAEKGGE